MDGASCGFVALVSICTLQGLLDAGIARCRDALVAVSGEATQEAALEELLGKVRVVVWTEERPGTLGVALFAPRAVAAACCPASSQQSRATCSDELVRAGLSCQRAGTHSTHLPGAAAACVTSRCELSPCHRC